MAAHLDKNDLLRSLRIMDCLLEKTGFNAEAKFFFFRVAEMKNLNLLQFAIYRVAIMMSYKRLSKTFGSDIKPFSLLSSTPTPFSLDRALVGNRI